MTGQAKHSHGIFTRLKSISSSLSRNPSFGLLFLSAKLNSPRLCAAILKSCIERVRQEKNVAHCRFPILVLNKSVFIEDVMAIAEHIEHAELFLLGRTHLHFIAKAFFKKEVSDNNYHDLTTQDDIRKYRDFLRTMWRALNAKLKIRCALSGNFSYFEERELAYVLESEGIPFVVVHKECLKTPGRIEEYEHLYRTNKGPFWGSRILVYNQIEKDLIVRSGVADAEKVKVVGMPRLDLVYKKSKSIANVPAPKVALLISFHKDLNALAPDPAIGADNLSMKADQIPNLENIWESTHLAMFELARSHPDVTVVIKTKGDHRDLIWLNDLIARNNLEAFDNLKIIHGGPIHDHLLAATVVCGVHSTALLEALAANKVVVVPVFHETSEKENARHFIDFGDSVVTVHSKSEFLERIETELLRANSSRGETPEPARALLEHWLGNSDGNASVRAADEIRKVVDSRTL